MSSVLEELYYGNIRPDVRYYEQDSSFVEAAKMKRINLDKFMATFNNTEKEIFEKYCDAQGEIEGITHIGKFTYGFKLGILLMMEVMQSKEALL